jgi:hypothetical protein
MLPRIVPLLAGCGAAVAGARPGAEADGADVPEVPNDACPLVLGVAGVIGLIVLIGPTGRAAVPAGATGCAAAVESGVVVLATAVPFAPAALAVGAFVAVGAPGMVTIAPGNVDVTEAPPIDCARGDVAINPISPLAISTALPCIMLYALHVLGGKRSWVTAVPAAPFRPVRARYSSGSVVNSRG